MKGGELGRVKYRYLKYIEGRERCVKCIQERVLGVSGTEEPPIRDLRDRATPPQKGLLFQPYANTLVYCLTSEIGMTSLQETK